MQCNNNKHALTESRKKWRPRRLSPKAVQVQNMNIVLYSKVVCEKIDQGMCFQMGVIRDLNEYFRMVGMLRVS